MFKEFQGGFILFGNLPGTLSHRLASYPRDTNIQTSFRGDHFQASDHCPAAY